MQGRHDLFYTQELPRRSAMLFNGPRMNKVYSYQIW